MKLSKNGTRRAALWLAVAGLAGGCGEGDGLKREAVSGKVTLNGKPLERGSIQFLPTQADQAAAAWGQIVDGAYSVGAADGPVAGEYSVSITSASSETPAAGALPGDDSGPADPNAVPEQYNLKTTLKATVEAGKANQLNYDLTSNPAGRKGRRS